MVLTLPAAAWNAATQAIAFKKKHGHLYAAVLKRASG